MTLRRRRDSVGVLCFVVMLVQYMRPANTAWTRQVVHLADDPVRVLAHIKKLNDCFGQFLVRAVCDCGACREVLFANCVSFYGKLRTPFRSRPVSVGYCPLRL